MAALTVAARLVFSHIRPRPCSVQILWRSAPVIKSTWSQNTFLRSIYMQAALLKEKKFSTDHEWVLMEENNSGKIGITDYAQDKLGDVVFIELPEVGATFEREDTFGTVESVKAASDVVAPVSGEILEVNSALEESPETINSDPYGAGWLIKMKLSNPSELDDLMTEQEYEKFIQD